MTKLQLMLHRLEQVCLPAEFILRKPQSELRDRVLSELLEEAEYILSERGDWDWLFTGDDKPQRNHTDSAYWAWIANRCSELIRLFVEPLPQSEVEIAETLTAFAEQHNATLPSGGYVTPLHPAFEWCGRTSAAARLAEHVAQPQVFTIP